MKKRIFVTLAGYVCFCAASVAGQGGDYNDIELALEELEGAIFVPDDHVVRFSLCVTNVCFMILKLFPQLFPDMGVSYSLSFSMSPRRNLK